MAFEPLTQDLNIIASLGDNPNSDNDLSAQELKEKFDEAGITIKKYLNDYLLPALAQAFGERVPNFGWSADAFLGTDENGKVITRERPVPVFTVGTVEVLEAGSDAYVTITGTNDNPVLNLGIPKGFDGSVPELTVGSVITVEPGEASFAYISGTAEAPKLHLGLPRGEAGAVPKFTVGTVESLDAGAAASASITGTEENPVLNLGIPKGAVPNLKMGAVKTGEADSAAEASIGGTAEEPVLNLSIPKGATGATPNLRIGNVETLEPGADATASISGSAENPVLSLGVPRGAAAFYVTLTHDEETDTWSADKTYKEIGTAYNAGMAVFCIVPVGTAETILPLLAYDILFIFGGAVSNSEYYSVSFFGSSITVTTSSLTASADMAAAEGESGHILNRTHWREQTTVELLPVTVTTSGEMSEAASYETLNDLNRNETVTVTFDGITYECVVWDYTDEDFHLIGIGNRKLEGLEDIDSGEPFVIIAIKDDINVYFTFEDEGEHTISVSGTGYTYHPLDAEYLPGIVPVIPTASVGQVPVVKSVDESGNPTEWEAIDSDSGADMNAARGEPGHILNRTHWRDAASMASVLPSTVVSESARVDGISYDAIASYDGVAVTFDGTTYICVPELVYDASDNSNVVFVGNKSMYNASLADSGEPFLFAGYKEAKYLTFYSSDDTEHTVSVNGCAFTYHPLREEYLPQTAPVIQTAEVGQAVVVKAVDENGVPTEWEAVDFPDGTQGNYTLPVANAETLGGVRPVAKTDTMTQPVGVDGTGALFTAPGESEGVTDEQVASAVSDYLDAHPEATTTVQDGSIERVKLSDKLARSLELTGGDIFGNTEQAEGASSFAEVFQTVKNEVMAEYAGDINKIPLIIHTDSHGTLDRSVFSTINELVNWLDVSKVLNLGDVVYKNWDSSNMQTNTQLQDMLDAVQDIPLHKRLDVYGNHDTWMTPSNGAYVKTDDQAFLQQYFRNVDARRYSNNGWFTVRDDYRNIKYVVLSPYEATTGNYASTAQIRFLINELGADDGYDIILVCHETLNPDWDNRVIPTTTDLTGSTVNSSLFWCGKNTNVIFSARQKRTSGTFTDSDGVVHEFDFSGCKTDVLCALHGHTHYDVYSYIDDALVCSSFSAFTCDERWVHFVLVDRANRELKVWKISTTDFTYATYTVPFDVPESAAKYRITRKLLNCTAYTVSNFVREGQPYAQRIVANSGYTLGDIIVEMGGEDVTESALSDDGYILIPSVSGDVKVTAVDDASDIATPFYVVTNNYSANIGDSGHARKDSSQTIVSIVIGEGQSYKVQSINAAEYHTYDLKVEMGGEDVTDSVTTYSRSTAIVEIDPVTDDVFITANAVPLGFTPVTIDENGVESESDSQYSSDYIDVSSYRSIVISPYGLGNFAVALYDGDKRFKTLLTGINGSTVVYISDDTKYVRFTNHSSLTLKVNDAHSENESFDVTITKPAGITIDNDISTVQAGGSVKVQAANTYEDTTMVVTAKCGTSTLSGVFDAETGNINVPYVNGALSIDISAKLNLTFPGDTTWVYSEKFYLADDTVLRATMYARQTVICYSEDGTKLGNCTIPNTGIFTLLEGTSYIVVNATLENVNAGNIELHITG